MKKLDRAVHERVALELLAREGIGGRPETPSRGTRKYELGDAPIPRIVALAMRALEDHPELRS